MGMGRMVEWRLHGLLYADDLVLCSKSEEMRAMVEWFVQVLRRRGLKVNAGMSKVMVLNGEEGLQYEVHVDGILLKHVSDFEYFGCVLDESGTNGAECSRKVASGKTVACAIRSLVNVRDLQFQYAKVLHATLLEPILM